MPKWGIVPSGSEVDPCCCGKVCNVIPMSLCVPPEDAVDVCGFPEFTAPASGPDPEAEGYVPAVEASCPPKFYKTRTVVYHHAKTKTQSVSCGGSLENFPGTSVDKTYVYETLDFTEKKTLAIDEDLECSPTITGEGTGFTAGWDDEDIRSSECGPNPFENFYVPCAYGSITWTYNAETGDFEWQTTIPDPEWTGDICATPEIPYTATHGFSFEYDWESETSSWSPLVITITNEVKTITYTDAEFTMTVTITLSDEVTLSDTLKSKVCDEDPCFEAEEDPNCEYCCTDRGSGRSGHTYLTIGGPLEVLGHWPVGCILPETVYAAWDTTICDGASTTRSGRATELSIWFKDLTVGSQYHVTLTFKRCAFATDPETFETIYPSACEAGPCAEGPYDTVTIEFDFIAEYWAEVLSQNCGRCDILLKRCELEDEANDWNTANPSEPPRYVGCTAGGYDVPVDSPTTYTWFDSCAYEEVLPE